MDKEEILKLETWSILDPRKGVAAFARYLIDQVDSCDVQSWIEALANNFQNYSGWETNPEVVEDFINDMLWG